MDYDMPDGSHFSLREVWRNTESGREDWPEFVYTSISATVDGKAYFGRLDERAEDVDEGDVLSCLEPIPPEDIFPSFQKAFTEAPSFDASKHYLKTPSFTGDDYQPGVTFVADCMLNEVNILEQLQSHRHANIIGYHGCVVEDGRITHICLERCRSSIVEYVEKHRSSSDIPKLIQDVKGGIEFLHTLGLAHNDINPENVCMVDGRAVLIDFDGCLPFGNCLMKGVSTAHDDCGRLLSAAENDTRGLEDLEDFLKGLITSDTPPSRRVTREHSAEWLSAGAAQSTCNIF